MHVLHISFPYTGSNDPDHDLASHALNMLVGAWRMNGQIQNSESGLAYRDAAYETWVLSPEASALDENHDNKYVRQAKQELHNIGIGSIQVNSRAVDIDGRELCSCSSVTSYILYTNYISLESALRCGSCFGPIPLYRIPYTHDEEYNNIICWQSNYQDCDRLFMNSSVLERSTHRELANFGSKLSQEGYRICRLIEQATGVPTYYVLKKHNGRSRHHEQQRLCPSCGQVWLLDEAWHHFDFACKPCRLVSNIAWNVR